MLILALETSLDETAAAVIDGDRVLSNIVWSQLKLHREWGGVVPSIARRAHEERLPAVVAAALRRSGLANNSITNEQFLISRVTAIAVTIGPGLAPALEVGIAYTKKLALQYGKPVIPVSHLEGHIASIFLRNREGNFFVSGIESINHQPLTINHFLTLIVSGGHTELTVTSISNRHPERSEPQTSGVEGSSKAIPVICHRLLGETLDDAAGECLDKVGRELGLGYPAGPVVEKVAEGSDLSGRSDPSRFQIPMARSPKTDLNFSFSGLKTAAVQWLHRSSSIGSASERPAVREMTKRDIADFCASFQEAVIDALLLKVRRAVKVTGIKTLLLSGGVSANNKLRSRVRQTMKKLGGQAFCAPKRFTGDNAAMIGLAAEWASARGELYKSEREINELDRQPNLNFAPADVQPRWNN